MQMLRSQIIRWLIYIAIWGFLFPGISTNTPISVDLVDRIRRSEKSWRTGHPALLKNAIAQTL